MHTQVGMSKGTSITKTKNSVYYSGKHIITTFKENIFTTSYLYQLSCVSRSTLAVP